MSHNGMASIKNTTYISTADYILYNSNFVILLAVCKYEMVYRWPSEVLRKRCGNLVILSSEMPAVCCEVQIIEILCRHVHINHTIYVD